VPNMLLDSGHKATSLFDEYPGFIQFPVMTLAVHRRWQKWLDSQEPEGFSVARFAEGNDGKVKLARFNYSSINMLFEFAETIKLGKLSSSSAEDWPLEVAVWAGDCAEEWLSSQISFRRYIRRSVAVVESGKGQAAEGGTVDDSPVE